MNREYRANFKHLYADVFWFGILAGSTMSFLSVFATRQGASSFEISLLTAAPGVMNLLFSLPAGRLLEGRPLVQATFTSSVLARLGYLALLPLPWLFAARGQVWGAILITLVMSVPATIFAIAFNAMFADAVPPEWRGQVVGRRNALLALSTTLSSLLCGALLDWIVFPTNYQVVFTLGALGAAMSSYHLGRLRLPPEPPVRVGQLLRDLARPGLAFVPDGMRWPVGLRFLTRSAGKPLIKPEVLKGPFGLLMSVYFFFYACQYTGIPIFPLFYVRVLNLTDGEISLGTAAFYTTMLFASMLLGRYSDRIGHRLALVSGASAFGIFPLLLALAQDSRLYWVASLLGGIAWAFTYSGLVNRLMERVPGEERPAYMALHNIALNLGILVGSLTGPLLAGWMGLRPSLFMVVGLRLLAGVLLALWG
jgi:MFS family permease